VGNGRGLRFLMFSVLVGGEEALSQGTWSINGLKKLVKVNITVYTADRHQ